MRPLWYVIIGITIGSAVTGVATAVAPETPSNQDPVQQSPEYYRVLLENDEVRVLEYRLRPAQKEPLHSHPEGVVYGFNNSRIRVASADGHVTESVGKAGDVFWRTPVTHAIENIGDTDVRSLAIEIKGSARCH